MKGITYKHHLQNFILRILMNDMFRGFHYRFLHLKTCLSAVKQADVGGTDVVSSVVVQPESCNG